MADSNSLILLPPRHTAQAPQSSSANQTSKSSSDDSFEQKLEKAKKQKAHATIKKQAIETPVKTASVKSPAAKPAVKTAGAATAEAKPAATPTKAVPAPAQDSTEADQPEQATADETKESPALADQANAANAAQVKKPVKSAKPAATKPAQPRPGVNLAGAAQKPADSADTTDAADSSSDEATPQAEDAEFGTGKIVAAAGWSGGKNSAGASASDDAASGQDSSTEAATAAAAADSVPVDPAAAIGAALSKITTQSDGQTGAISTDLSALGLPTSTATPASLAAKTAAPVATPQAQFAEDNHPKIVSSIQGQLLPNGGTLQLRLNPADLGSLQVTVHMHDGVMSASFETSNEGATKLLSHSLGQLKSGLEAAGMSVDKLQVEQAPKREAQGDSDGSSKQPPQEQQQQAQQDQQRREMVQRMWRKLAGGGNPLDLVA